MPRMQQPIPLRKAALQRLVDYFADHVYQLSANWVLSHVQRSIAQIKGYVYPCLPPRMYNEFGTEFLDKFLWIQRDNCDDRPGSHNRAALEVLMDVDIIGLELGGDIMKYVDYEDAFRFRRLNVLKLNHEWTNIGTKSLGYFDLRDLTELHYAIHCADRDLEAVGACCRKLLVLDVTGAEGVTDRGLKALYPCSELRTLWIAGCKVSDKGMNELLTANKKITEFNFRFNEHPLSKRCNSLSTFWSSVCPSMKRISMESDLITNEHMRIIVKLFPNLTSLSIEGKLKCDFYPWEQLDKLENYRHYST